MAGWCPMFPQTTDRMVTHILTDASSRGNRITIPQMNDLGNRVRADLANGIPYEVIRTAVRLEWAREDLERAEAEHARAVQNAAEQTDEVEPTSNAAIAQDEQQPPILEQPASAAQRTNDDAAATTQPPTLATHDDTAENAADTNADEELVNDHCGTCDEIWDYHMTELWQKLWGGSYSNGKKAWGQPPNDIPTMEMEGWSGSRESCPDCGRRVDMYQLHGHWINWLTNTRKLKTLKQFEFGEDAKGHQWMRKKQEEEVQEPAADVQDSDNIVPPRPSKSKAKVQKGPNLNSENKDDAPLRRSNRLKRARGAEESGDDQAQELGATSSVLNTANSEDPGVSSPRPTKRVRLSENDAPAAGDIGDSSSTTDSESDSEDIVAPPRPSKSGADSMEIDLSTPLPEIGGLGAAERAVNRGEFFQRAMQGQGAGNSSSRIPPRVTFASSPTIFALPPSHNSPSSEPQTNPPETPGRRQAPSSGGNVLPGLGVVYRIVEELLESIVDSRNPRLAGLLAIIRALERLGAMHDADLARRRAAEDRRRRAEEFDRQVRAEKDRRQRRR